VILWELKGKIKRFSESVLGGFFFLPYNPKTVVPAQAGTQFDVCGDTMNLDPGLRRDDGL